ncbi:MAG TPA: flagellar motor protein MotB [Chondromyces sp.]|nr:flagellar motor protein MotB [Chondromyces sp.]
MASRRRKKKNEHIDESWLLPYSDLMTLLVALFIVLFASSSVDAQRFEALSRAFNQVFEGGVGVMEYPNPVSQDTISTDEEIKESLNGLGKQEQRELSKMQDNVNQYIRENNLEEKVETSLTGEGLMLRIRENVLFDSGLADIRTEDIKVAEEISRLLEMDLPRNIVISGHTDNIPIKNDQFESNWELSAMRAVNFMKVILENEKLDPRQFSAKGFGEYQPIASNDTEEGRAKNRRVEILILPQGQQE